MDLKEQEYIVALAQYRSITKAAQALFISQPTLSIFLNRLETRLGIQVFEKVGKRLIPTEAGELYARRARELLLIQDQFHSELSDLISGTHGRLRLGIHSRSSAYLLPKVMAKFHALYPNVDLIITETSSEKMERRLLQGNLDLILSNRFFEVDRLTFFPVYQDTLGILLPPSHPAVDKAVLLPGHLHPWLDLRELEDEFLILQDPSQATRVFTDRAFQYFRIKPKRFMIIKNMETAAQMAAEGVGAAFTMESYAKYFKYEKPFCFFETGDPDFSVQISMAHRKGAHLSKFTETFIRLIRENFNG